MKAGARCFQFSSVYTIYVALYGVRTLDAVYSFQRLPNGNWLTKAQFCL